MKLGYHLLERSAFAFLHAHQWLRRAQYGTQAMAGAALGEALSSDERRAMTLALYGRAGTGVLDEPLAWEPAWWKAALPAQGHVLIGAAGRGREIEALLAAGYRVDAFEPVLESTRYAQRRFQDRARVYAGDYEALVRATLGETSSLEAIAQQRYDAALLGWGSFGHVLGAPARLALLRAFDTLTSGPLLLSFAGAPVVKRGRAHALGQGIGTLVARARGMRPEEEAVFFIPHAGFSAALDRASIDALADALDRDSHWGPEGTYPHVSLHRRSSDRASGTRLAGDDTSMP